jgi:glycosyltransferase involved in cell wall biosynthesis
MQRLSASYLVEYMKIPIILISFNNHAVFRRSIESLIENTSKIYELIIVDNNSSDLRHRRYLNGLHDKGVVKLYQNKYNQFTLGLNKCLKELDSDLIAICDSDFLYPEPLDGECWLSVLVREMQESPYIGKLGLSISLENIQNKKNLEDLYKREREFSSISLNNNVWAAQVDTTPALYRKDLFFWGKFRLYPGHMSANKPFYHIGRHKKTIGYHMGWDSDEYIGKDLITSRSKIDSFAFYGGALDGKLVNNLNIFLKFRYFGLKFISKLFWVSFKVFMFVFFLLKRRIFFINELLYKK